MGELELINLISQCLDSTIALQRQLLDGLRIEKEALIQADLKQIEESALAKQTHLHVIAGLERKRLQYVVELGKLWGVEPEALTLETLVRHIQTAQPELSDRLSVQLRTLRLMAERCEELNSYNGALIAQAINNIEAMKANLLKTSAQPSSGGYTSQGEKTSGAPGARILSQEA